MYQIFVFEDVFIRPILILGWCDYFEPTGISSVINLFLKGQMPALSADREYAIISFSVGLVIKMTRWLFHI